MNPVTITVDRDGPWYVARPSRLTPGYVTIVASSSKISEADARANLQKLLAAYCPPTGQQMLALTESP